jgi:hypothetical protein
VIKNTWYLHENGFNGISGKTHARTICKMSTTDEVSIDSKKPLKCFEKDQLTVVNDAVAIAEELTSNAFKMSFAQWRQRRYDVKTLANLLPEEIVDGPFAQIIRFLGRKPDSSLGSSKFDFYKICLQDHNILAAQDRFADLKLFPFILYIVCHELIHVIRFSTFLQAFDASQDERFEEEARVHDQTRSILENASIKEMPAVFEFYRAWKEPLDRVRDL